MSFGDPEPISCLHPEGPSVSAPASKLHATWSPRFLLVAPLPSACVCRYVWLNKYISQFLPIAGLLGLRVVVGIGEFLVKRFGKKKKKDRMQEMADEYGRHRATEFNVGAAGSRRDTGVRYSDVAGIDAVKSEIEETMHMILGAPEFQAIGAKAPRVSMSHSLLPSGSEGDWG